MYICPICQRAFDKEEVASKHYLKCWKEKNPCHQAKSAPRSEDLNTREITNEVADFFSSFQKG